VRRRRAQDRLRSRFLAKGSTRLWPIARAASGDPRGVDGRRYLHSPDLLLRNTVHHDGPIEVHRRPVALRFRIKRRLRRGQAAAPDGQGGLPPGRPPARVWGWGEMGGGGSRPPAPPRAESGIDPPARPLRNGPGITSLISIRCVARELT